MIHAEIRSLHCPDIEGDLATYEPLHPHMFGLLVQLFAGPSDGPGEESFDIIVCTPEWLKDRLKQHDGIVVGRHHLIVDSFDHQHLVEFLGKYARSCWGESWEVAALKLARLGHWEFED